MEKGEGEFGAIESSRVRSATTWLFRGASIESPEFSVWESIVGQEMTRAATERRVETESVDRTEHQQALAVKRFTDTGVVVTSRGRCWGCCREERREEKEAFGRGREGRFSVGRQSVVAVIGKGR